MSESYFVVFQNVRTGAQEVSRSFDTLGGKMVENTARWYGNPELRAGGPYKPVCILRVRPRKAIYRRNMLIGERQPLVTSWMG